MKIKYIGAAIVAFLTISNVFSQSYFSRVIEQADALPETYGEICEEFYTSFDKLLNVEVDVRADGTPNIVVDTKSENVHITFRLSVNDVQYSLWKIRTLKKIDKLNLSNKFSTFEDTRARMIAGKGFLFGDNEEAAISRWEKENSDVKRYRDYLIYVEFLDINGKVIEKDYISIKKFNRVGYDFYPLPLHNLNRLNDYYEIIACGEDEDSYYTYTRPNSTLEWMNSIGDIRCRVMSLTEVQEYREEQARIASEEAEQERLAREEAEHIARERATEEAEREKKEYEEQLRTAAELAIPELLKNMVQIPNNSDHKGLYFCKYEVTQALWYAVMDTNPSYFSENIYNPVERVSLSDCLEFVEKLNALPEIEQSGFKFRLPTAKEWIYACRAGGKGDFGLHQNGRQGSIRNLADICWYKSNSRSKTHHVGWKKPNAWGLYDMHGNVWEWTISYDGDSAIVKGGGWNTTAGYCEVGYLFLQKKETRGNSLGFRLVAETKEFLVEQATLALENSETSEELGSFEGTEKPTSQEILIKNLQTHSISEITSLIENIVLIPNKNQYFCKYEVTQGLWEAIMGNNPSRFKGDLNRPVENVSWNDCQEFIRKLNESKDVKAAGLSFRLPTREEWEYACRAGSTGKYGLLENGQEATIELVGWYDQNSGGKTHPVGQKKPNAWGLYDMHGNVYEWTTSLKDLNRIRCGGSFYSIASICSVVRWTWNDPNFKRYDVGFRLVAEKRK